MKFNYGEHVKIINEDLLNNEYEYDGAVGVIGEVDLYDKLNNTYLIKVQSAFDYFELNDGVWVHENNLDFALPTQPYFTPVVDKHRKHPDVELIYPKMGSRDAIACDFFSPVDIVIPPMEGRMIWLDFKAIFPRKLALLINVRSNMGKQPVMLGNTQGWIESDYANNETNDGNIGINLLNLGKTDYVIKQGDRIAQGMFVEVHRAKGTETDNKRVGGHGSTGK